MGQWFQRFVASSIHGEVSDATIQGYLRSASQIEEVWQQIDDNVDALIAQGMAPWDAYAKMGYALAFVRACRTNVVFVEELLKAAAAADPTRAGYLPKVTYDQALALCEHIEPYLEEAIKASTNPRYVPTAYTFPLALGPRIRYANQRFPLAHLQGIIGAAQQMRDWAAGLLAKYELALDAAKTPVPQAVSTHLEEMKSELRLGDFHLRTGVDMVGQISKGQVTDELSEKAEGFLWEAMESFFKVSQLVANPRAPAQPMYRDPRVVGREQYRERHTSPRSDPGRPVQPEPNVTDMLNQVIAGPGATQGIPAQPTPDASDLLNQVIADPGATQAVPAQPTPNTSDLLNQVIAGPGATQAVPAQSAPDVSDLLNQVIADSGTTHIAPTQSSTQGSHVIDRKPHPNKPTPEDNLLEMLSNVCGEQKEDN